MKVAHLTSVHPRDDVRIFFKECTTLAAQGYDVSLVVADGGGDEVVNGVSVLGVASAPGRVRRMLGAVARVRDRAIQLDADVYHLHDPELLLIADSLLRSGKRVIFDAHEDLPAQLLHKRYIWRPLRMAVASVAWWYQRRRCRRLSAVVTATPSIAASFSAAGIDSVDINNYPLLDELRHCGATAAQPARAHICYLGGMSAMRGTRQLIDALPLLKSGARLQLAGPCSDLQLWDGMKHSPGWSAVDYLGQLPRGSLPAVLSQCFAGIVTFLPAPNHVKAQPNKLFEYMSAGVPVVASDFPAWREIVEGSQCGVCVDPLDPAAIAQAIDFLAMNREEAARMGENGLRAVRERYNWAREGEKLGSVYARIEAESQR